MSLYSGLVAVWEVDSRHGSLKTFYILYDKLENQFFNKVSFLLRVIKLILTVKKGDSISRYLDMTYKQNKCRSIPWPVIASCVSLVC